MSNEELFKNYVSVVESAISQLGVSIDLCRTDNPYAWSLQKGSSHIWVQLQATAAFAGNKGLLLICSPFMEIPKDEAVKASLLLELMKMNHQASITSFSVADNGYIYLLSNRFVTGMETAEVLEMLQEIGVYGDYFDDILNAKYGSYINRMDDANERM